MKNKKTKHYDRRLSGEILLALVVMFAAPASATDSGNVNTPDPDLALLGRGVLQSLPGNSTITSAADVFTPRQGTWRYKVDDGSTAGTVIIETMTSMPVNGKQYWRRSNDSATYTEFEIGTSDVMKTSVSDPKHQLLMQYDPGEPELLDNISQGEVRTSSYGVRAVSMSNTADVRATGTLQVSYQYLGMYRANTPAGTFDTYGVKKALSGKVGSTAISTTLYVFYAPGIGEVARIDHVNVRAFLLYNQDTRVGYLLESLPEFVKP